MANILDNNSILIAMKSLFSLLLVANEDDKGLPTEGRET
jgi:hypothetical protein